MAQYCELCNQITNCNDDCRQCLKDEKRMDKDQLLNLIDEKVNEIFLAYQEANDVPSGDISPYDDYTLDRIKYSLAALIIHVCKEE